MDAELLRSAEDYDEVTFGIRDGGRERLCVRCGRWVKAEEYQKTRTYNRRGKRVIYRGTMCALCDSLQRYQLTAKDYLEMLDRQGGVCWICQTDTPGGTGRWHVDHNHACCDKLPTCGECNRALLCSQCNTGLGLFKDDSNILRRAADYLEFEYM